MKVDPRRYWNNIPRPVNRFWGDETSEAGPPRYHDDSDSIGEGTRKEFEYGD